MVWPSVNDILRRNQGIHRLYVVVNYERVDRILVNAGCRSISIDFEAADFADTLYMLYPFIQMSGLSGVARHRRYLERRADELLFVVSYFVEEELLFTAVVLGFSVHPFAIPGGGYTGLAQHVFRWGEFYAVLLLPEMNTMGNFRSTQILRERLLLMNTEKHESGHASIGSKIHKP